MVLVQWMPASAIGDLAGIEAPYPRMGYAARNPLALAPCRGVGPPFSDCAAVGSGALSGA